MTKGNHRFRWLRPRRMAEGGIFVAYKIKVAPQFNQEIFQVVQQTLVQIGLGMAWRQAQELHQIAVFENALWLASAVLLIFS